MTTSVPMSKMYLAFDRDICDVVPVMWDHVNFVFFEPISEKEYDYPWVFISESDAYDKLPLLIEEELHTLKEQIYKIGARQLVLTLTQCKLSSIPVYYYVDRHANTIKLACPVNYIDASKMMDLLTKEPITEPLNFYDNSEDAMVELEDFRCNRI